MLEDIIQKIPKKFEHEIVETKYPIDYKNCFNSVLLQEIVRFNNLHQILISSLKDIENAMKGTIIMSEQLEQV